MKINAHQAWTIVFSTTILAATFSLGYLAGSKSQKNPVETENSLTVTDMEHAFGSVKSTAHEPDTQDKSAMSLGGLVEGLEKKVAANPENIDQQLLLAQTYNELDNRTKSLKLLHSLNKQVPKNVQVKIILATVLMKGSDRQELKMASQLFDEAIKLKPEVSNMARLYQGEIKVKLDNMGK